MTSDTPAPAQEAHVEALIQIATDFRDANCPECGERVWHHNHHRWGDCRRSRDEARALWLAAFVAERQAGMPLRVLG